MKTIKNNKEIQYIYKNGQRINFPFLTVILLEENSEEIEGNVAFIAGKKHGNSVWRNKSKRILREVYKKIKIKNKILLIANKKTQDYKIEEMVDIIKRKLKEYDKEN